MIFALLRGKNHAKTFRDTPLYQGFTPLAIIFSPLSGFFVPPKRNRKHLVFNHKLKIPPLAGDKGGGIENLGCSLAM